MLEQELVVKRSRESSGAASKKRSREQSERRKDMTGR